MIQFFVHSAVLVKIFLCPIRLKYSERFVVLLPFKPDCMKSGHMSAKLFKFNMQLAESCLC